jgi:DNA-binding CsgD family transcriptional regulator
VSAADRCGRGRVPQRRRLRRDLHDGLGPVLTGVVLNAEAALRLVRSDPGRSEALLGDLRDQATGALEDIRRLGALHEYAMVLSRRADGSPLSVTVRAAGPLDDLPAAAEVAAYRIVTGALTNITRHSTAACAVVSLTAGDGELHAAVHDDGTSAGTGSPAGVGLTSIRERGRAGRALHNRAGPHRRLAAGPGLEGSVVTLGIVVADDHAVVREGIRALLSAVDGYELVGDAGTGSEAVRAAVTLRPNVIVVDAAPGGQRPVPGPHPREREVLGLIATGLSNGAIATRLSLAPNTVGNHISNIFAKLRMAGRAEAIVRARSAGLGN